MVDPEKQNRALHAHSGDAALGTDYRLVDSSGNVLTDTVTIPAGQGFADVRIQPVDDQIPEWTEAMYFTLATSNDYNIDGANAGGSAELVDNDLGITLGNGSANLILQG